MSFNSDPKEFDAFEEGQFEALIEAWERDMAESQKQEARSVRVFIFSRVEKGKVKVVSQFV